MVSQRTLSDSKRGSRRLYILGDFLETRMRKTGRKDGDVDEIVFEAWATSPGEKARIVLSRRVAVASRL